MAPLFEQPCHNPTQASVAGECYVDWLGMQMLRQLGSTLGALKESGEKERRVCEVILKILR